MGDFRDKLSVWLATGLGVGLVSPAPGTVGGLWGLPLAWAVLQLPETGTQLGVIFILGLLGVAICSRATQALGGSKDPQSIVLDEILALPIVYLGIGQMTCSTWIIGWILFRLFDITKPSPARQAERLPGGLGIMADDFVAAGFACAVLHAVVWIW